MSGVKLLISVAGFDWGTFRKEGDLYLRRLSISDVDAVYFAAKLFLLDLNAWQAGLRWQTKRNRWEKPSLTTRLDTPTVFDKTGKPLLDWNGKFLPPSKAPSECEGCGGICAQMALYCIVCWDEIRPRKKGVKRRHRPESRYLAGQ